MAIKIFCDLCEKEREIAQVKGVECSGAGMVLTAPSMASGHFVCEECLKKIGWSAGAVCELVDDVDKVDTVDGRGRNKTVKNPKARRRGVAVLLTWKNSGEFEVLTSIAAACDRIGEKTGKVISGADISHALLKERVFNADGFMVKYANSANSTEKTEKTENTESADGEVAGREDRFQGGNELKLEEAGA